MFNENGADILRLWAASADYHADVRCSKEIFKQLSQNYLKFRNTCKFMLDNLVDFDPEKLTKPEDMPVLDRWLLTKLNELIEKAEQSYCDYEFHIITHAVNDFCVNTLSSFYLDIVKDRLYCEGAESATRRSAQTALYLTLHTLSKLFAPILAFTCDEIWLAMPHTGDDDARNVVLNEMNKPFTAYALDSETMARWEHIIAVRTVVNGALEEARAAKVIGKSLEADVHLTVPTRALRRWPTSSSFPRWSWPSATRSPSRSITPPAQSARAAGSTRSRQTPRVSAPAAPRSSSTCT